MKMEKISIIIPIYNSSKYLKECLDSIINQSYKNWEAVCVNDGSTDNSLEILDQYAAIDKRIKVYTKENGGAASARNFALNNINNADWISFVDSDDYISPLMYQEIISELSKYHNEIEYVRLFSKKTNKRKIENVDYKGVKSKLFTCYEYFSFADVGGFMSSLFIRSSIVQDNNIRFNEAMRVLEDQEFSIKCALNSRTLMLFYPNYYYYYYNPFSLTNIIQDNGRDVIECVNSVYLNIVNCNIKLLESIFFKKYFSEKLKLYIDNKLQCKSRKNELNLLNKDIKFTLTELTFQYKVKYMIFKVISLI